MAQAIQQEGLERVAQVILNDTTHLAVGTGTATPASTDTQLATETFRQAPTKTLRQGKEFQARSLFANADLPATAQEYGLFLNGTGVANSGSILFRGTQAFTKGTKDLYLIIKMTVN